MKKCDCIKYLKLVETVGGAVDILVITPDEVKWLQKTELKWWGKWYEIMKSRI